MKRLIALVIGILGTVASAQTPSAPISGIAVNQHGQPIPYAQIRVCNVSSTGIPCNPTANIFQDYTLTHQIANPTNADQFGNYTVYVGIGVPNLYTVQISSPNGGQTFTYAMNGPATNGGGGTGSVTQFSSGNLSPLFTTSVTNPNTTPAQSFNLLPVPSGSFLGNFGAGTVPPQYWSLLAGANVTLTPNITANTLTISSTGGGGGGGATIPHVTQTISGDGTGNGLGMPEKQNTISGGQAFVASDEDVANGRFDCRNPAYAGGCLGPTPQLAMQAFRDRLICYQSITGKKARTSFPPGIIPVGTPSAPTLFLPIGASYENPASFPGAMTTFQATYNNVPAVQFDGNQTSSTNCSDGVPHTNTLVSGSYIGFTEHGCNQGGCVNVPGDSGNYPLGGPKQTGIVFNDAQGKIDRVGANNNGGDGIVVNGLEPHTGELWGSNNNYYFYFGMDTAGQNYQFAPHECHGDIDLYGLDGQFSGPNEATGAFMVPGWEYGKVAGICWGGGNTYLGTYFSQIEEIGVIRVFGSTNGWMGPGRIDAPRGDGIQALGGGDTYVNPRINTACIYNGLGNYLVYQVNLATTGSGQTPGTYTLTASSGGAQIQVTVGAGGTVTTNPVVSVHGRGYSATAPSFTLSAGGTPATFTVVMEPVYFDLTSGAGQPAKCDYVKEQAGGDTFIEPHPFTVFFGQSFATGLFLPNTPATWYTSATLAGLPTFDNLPSVNVGQSQRIVQADVANANGGSGVAGTTINLNQTGGHIVMGNTTPTNILSITGGVVMQDYWILGDGFSTLPANQVLACAGSGFTLLLNKLQWYHFFVSSVGLGGAAPILIEQCDSIDQNFWQVGYNSVLPPPNPLTLSNLDVAGDAAVRSLTQPGSGFLTSAGPTSSFNYCWSMKVWFSGGVAATTPLCSTIPPQPVTASSNLFFNANIPLNWTQYKVYLQSTTDPSTTPGVYLSVASPNGEPQAQTSIRIGLVPFTPSDTSVIPTANLGTKSLGLYHMDSTDIPTSSTSLGVTGQIQIDPVAGKLWYATGQDTWTSWTLGGGGGGGGTVTGTGTANTLAMWLTPTSLTNSPLSVASGVLTSSDPFAVNDGSGNGGTFHSIEGTDPAPATGDDQLFGEAATHRFAMQLNGLSKVFVPGLIAPGNPGDCPVFGASGYDFVTSGAPCGSTGTGFTPTRVVDSGAGTGATVTLVAGANDNTGYINITTGTSPAPSAGVVTVNYGGTYAAARKCSVDPASAATTALGANGMFITSGNSTNTQFVITVGSTPLAASTAYAVIYRCGT